jgi:hypothetical protein
MKRRQILAVCSLIFAFLASAAGFAQETYKFQIPADNEPYHGTWINKEYAGTDWRTTQKNVNHSWGDAESFLKIADEKPFGRFTYILVEKWTDSKGNTWYKELEQRLGGKSFHLCRVSKDGNTLEKIWRSAGFPTESDMNPKFPNYWIFHRQ